MKIYTLTLGELGTNCYIIASDNNNAAVIDPADDADAVSDFLNAKGLSLKLILLTHGHFDHTGAGADLKEKYGAKVYIHKSDEELLSDTDKNVAYLLPGYPYKSFSADVTVSDGDEIVLDEINFRVMHTPGHTEGSIMFITDGAIFSGDTFFESSVGRTDFYSGSPRKQQESLAKIMKISGDYDVYPGHGLATTLKAEKRYNPYLIGSGLGNLFEL